MMPANTPEVVRMVWQTLELSDAVGGISLGGSRAKDYATRLSDWDLYLNGEPARLMAELPGLVAPLRPLAAFWEPLSEDAGYMMVMDGPVKVDLFPVGGRRSLQPPWELSGTTLGAIDGHFWDWVLWLGSKALRGEAELVSDELAKMRWFLLGPLGVDRTPADLGEAVRLYLDARSEASGRFQVRVPEGLGRQVLAALREHQLVSRA
ncbi:MAG TPA: hypothetical protein VN767_04015 [Streptosporangiaceae bacterium]|nr:hypothetical protein [Streptosporangiaceae bacterium]